MDLAWMTASDTKPFPYLALFTVALAVFLSVTIEMLPTGLLSYMSAELEVPESFIGLTVSVFAFTVVLTSAPLAHLTRRVDRHRLVIIVLLVLVVSTVITVFAPNYTVLVISRVIGGVAHGIFWTVIGAYAAYLVPKEQIGRAVSISLGGGSLAFVLGVPLGTALGQAVGWRASFGVLAALTLVGTFFVWKLLPKVSMATDTASIPTVTSATGSIVALTEASAVPRRDQSVLAVVFVCIITAVTMIGQYTFYTYIEPFLRREVGLDAIAISPALFAYGAMGVVALVIVGVWFGSRPRTGLMIAAVAVLVSVGALGLWPELLPVAVPAFLVWGLSMGMLPPLLQTRVLHAAPARIRDTSSAFYTTAFNIGIGGGALVGSIALEQVGLGSLPHIYVGFLVAAIILILVSDAILQGRAGRRVVAH
jgi:predicted MFS family arabinose efflux permease